MTFQGNACASGAGTIINAIATWKGAAFGIDLLTFAEVELSEDERGISGFIEEMPEGDTRLIEQCVEMTLERFGLEMGGTVKTRSDPSGRRAQEQQCRSKCLSPCNPSCSWEDFTAS